MLDFRLRRLMEGSQNQMSSATMATSGVIGVRGDTTDKERRLDVRLVTQPED